MIRHPLAPIAVLTVFLTTAEGKEPNAKSYVAMISADNTLLAAETGKAYTINALAVIATSDTPVGFYLDSAGSAHLRSSLHEVIVRRSISSPAARAIWNRLDPNVIDDSWNETKEEQSQEDHDLPKSLEASDFCDLVAAAMSAFLSISRRGLRGRRCGATAIWARGG